eukprot:GHVH01010065.1.p3 GENE.GHVH01010065.1~~GHVH01010065.1.p3  ORF type:complete len:108 (-),score=10.17 GHVH01010065.1:251-574(-)
MSLSSASVLVGSGRRGWASCRGGDRGAVDRVMGIRTKRGAYWLLPTYRRTEKAYHSKHEEMESVTKASKTAMASQRTELLSLTTFQDDYSTEVVPRSCYVGTSWNLG